MNYPKRLITFLIGLILTAGTYAGTTLEREEDNVDGSNLLAFWALSESFVLVNSIGARYSPAVVGAANLLGLALSKPSGVSTGAKVGHYASYLILSGYDFYAEEHVPHNRMFWQQFIGLHIAMFTPGIIDHFVGHDALKKETKSWQIELVAIPAGLQLNARFKFGSPRKPNLEDTDG